MRIVNLMENTEGAVGCVYAHGLSFYIETAKHKILLDLGPSEKTLENAKVLGIDLSAVDTVILSHGHYDHSGGILAFAKQNPHATIYMQAKAPGEYYADDGTAAGVDRYRYIGIDPAIAKLPQVKFVGGDLKIDEELRLFTIEDRRYPLPFTNKRLLKKVGEGYEPDDFVHEQYLVIGAEGRRILMSGCAHNGILSILDAYRQKIGGSPDLVISGFHLMKKSEYSDEELREIIDIAKELKKYPTRFITCHCTGVPAYKVMRNIMGSKLEYAHSGEEIDIYADEQQIKEKRRAAFMKWHKFFAWATVFCFVMTMVTGYQRK